MGTACAAGCAACCARCCGLCCECALMDSDNIVTDSATGSHCRQWNGILFTFSSLSHVDRCTSIDLGALLVLSRIHTSSFFWRARIPRWISHRIDRKSWAIGSRGRLARVLRTLQISGYASAGIRASESIGSNGNGGAHKKHSSAEKLHSLIATFVCMFRGSNIPGGADSRFKCAAGQRRRRAWCAIHTRFVAREF
jgi:hypothetical protein